MPSLLFLYCLSEVVPPFVAGLLIFTAVLLLGQLAPLLDVVVEFGVGAADFLRLLCYLAPPLLVLAVPLAALVAVILAFSRMASDGEIMALKACGTGVCRLLPAVLAAAVLAGLATAWVTADLLPAGKQAGKQLLFHLARERFARSLQPRTFNQVSGDFALYLEQRAGNGNEGEWEGVFAVDARDRHRPLILVAERARVGAGPAGQSLDIRLWQGSLHQTLGEESRTVFFDSFTLSIPVPAPRMVAGARLDQRDKRELSLAGLQRAIAAARDPARRAELAVEFHKRLAIPLGAAILVVTGMPLGLLARPGRRAAGLPLGVAVYLLYFLALSSAGALAETGAFPAATVWVVDGVLALLAVGLLRLVTSPLLDRLFELADGLAHRLSSRRQQEEAA